MNMLFILECIYMKYWKMKSNYEVMAGVLERVKYNA